MIPLNDILISFKYSASTVNIDDIAVSEERGGDGSRLPAHAYAPRFQSRSATATPTTSPKKRQLPQIPHQV